MAERRVKQTRKDKDGDITALCNSDSTWSPRLKKDAISDIEKKTYSYYVQWKIGERTGIHVVDDPKKGKYLRTDRDKTTRNNLRDLPDC